MNIFKKITHVAYRLFDLLENSNIHFGYLILTFFFVINLRDFLELLPDKHTMSLNEYVHYTLGYIAIALTLILLLHLVANVSTSKVAKIVFPFFGIIITPPIFDLIISRGAGYQPGYLFPLIHDDILYRFMTIGGNWLPIGITPGIKIEIVFITLVSCLYFYKKTNKILKSIFGAFLVYSVFMIYAFILFWIKFVQELFGEGYTFSDQLLSNCYLVIIVVIGLILAYRTNSKYFLALLRDLRFLRLSHYFLMVAFGMVISYNQDIVINTVSNPFFFLFIPISIIAASIYSIITNNIEDLEIDRISNPDRPLKIIPLKTYQTLSWGFLFISLFYAIMVSFDAFFLIALWIGNYFFYSVPPFRLKRITFFSKTIIALNSLIFVLLGYTLMTGSLQNFPNILFAFFLIGFTAVINFIDLKDYEGDKQCGIKTLPVVLGMTRAQQLIGTFFLLIYPSIYLLIPDSFLLLLLAPIGILQFYLVNRHPYKETPVFLTHLISFSGFLMYLILFQVNI